MLTANSLSGDQSSAEKGQIETVNLNNNVSAKYDQAIMCFQVVIKLT